MGKKNVVSIEERIPKLKQERKKKANRRLVFYLSIFFFLISIIVYLQSSLSHVKTIEVSGNTYTNDQKVIDQSGISEETNIWMVNKSNVVQAITKNPIVKSVEVNRKLPWTIEIQITENDRVGYVKRDDSFYPILGNGKILTGMKQKTVNGNSPLLLGFSDEAYLHELTSELKKLPESILNLISEIHWKPNDENQNKIILYMNDGYMVDGTIRNFADNMKVYPSIIAQLNPDNKGIIHIGVGAYFEKFDKKSEASSDEEKPNNDNRE
ncbi:cell division protein FtsQ/DivIB [Virgibacillus doumboii]|uniref:cell division protein FtsQ/DivIB n=1 Tax=Virgibacillus doumboii TaxID=2697503 RepID=UPI0013DFA4CF|nr:FtsQ-type POTRA domain-containing protein [Virgibacillus doumboii]